jgi:hypothetical protein
MPATEKTPDYRNGQKLIVCGHPARVLRVDGPWLYFDWDPPQTKIEREARRDRVWHTTKDGQPNPRIEVRP